MSRNPIIFRETRNWLGKTGPTLFLNKLCVINIAMFLSPIYFLCRDALESDLIFLGILIWQNRLKPESQPVIKELQKSNIRTTMVTGKL